MMQIDDLFNLVQELKGGRALFIQSGDTGDFDGYLAAAGAQLLKTNTPGLEYAVAVPTRIACRDITVTDPMTHDNAYAEEVMHTAGKVLRVLCPDAMLVEGGKNECNIFPPKMMFDEVNNYGPLVPGNVDIAWTKMKDLANRIMDKEIEFVMLDMIGSMAYLVGLTEHLGPDGTHLLGEKIKASGVPIMLMTGVLAEVAPVTMALPGRDSRAGMNGIYHRTGLKILLGIAQKHDIPLIFVSNNACNKLAKFQDPQDVQKTLELKGLLAGISSVWFDRPYFLGKCVIFDWVSFCTMILFRKPGAEHLVQMELRELMVGVNDAAVLVLVGTDPPAVPLEDTQKWGSVLSVTHVDFDAMIQLAVYTAKNAVA